MKQQAHWISPPKLDQGSGVKTWVFLGLEHLGTAYRKPQGMVSLPAIGQRMSINLFAEVVVTKFPRSSGSEWTVRGSFFAGTSKFWAN